MSEVVETRRIITYDLIGRMNKKGGVDCLRWGGTKNMSIGDMMENLMITRGSSTFVVRGGEVKAPVWMVTYTEREDSL
ncbi:MAG: hypothetical protein WAV41_02285 [Microgenomates group bacterium]